MNGTSQRSRRSLVALGFLASATLLAACGTVGDVQTGSNGLDAQQNSTTANLDWRSSDLGETIVSVDGSTLTVDVGTGKSLTIDNGEPLKIALFNAASTTTYTQAIAKGANDVAEELDADLTVFDAGWDPNTQLAQIENAILGEQFDAFIVYAVDASAPCKALTEDAPAKNILVLPIVSPLCGHGLEEGLDLWAPGTVSSVFGGGTLGFYSLWAENISRAITEPTEVLYVAGPAGQEAILAAEEALKKAQADNPNFKVVNTIYTDFSTTQGLEAVQNGLLADPGVTVVLSHFSAMTTGIVQGLKEAGRPDVNVYDLGGDASLKPLLEQGAIVQSVPYFPYTAAACAVDILAAAYAGTSIPRVVLSECVKSDSGTGSQTNVVIDKSTVAAWAPEY